MRYSEINEFNRILRNISISGIFKQNYYNGSEWDDVPFNNVNRISLKINKIWTRGRNKIDPDPQYSLGWDVYIRELPTNPNWKQIFENLDQLVGDSGDTHHFFVVGVEVDDDVLFFDLDS